MKKYFPIFLITFLTDEDKNFHACQAREDERPETYF